MIDDVFLVCGCFTNHDVRNAADVLVKGQEHSAIFPKGQDQILTQRL